MARTRLRSASVTSPIAHTPASQMTSSQTHCPVRLDTVRVLSGVIPGVGSDLSAKDPVSPPGVGQDHRHDQERTDQREAEALGRPGGVPDRDARRNDVRPEADAEAAEAEEDQAEREEKRRGMRFGLQ